jgi:aminopeptidase N
VTPLAAHFLRRRATACALALGLIGAAAIPAWAIGAPSPGAPGAGDSYFPRAGNGGYDVKLYRLRLRYNPDSDRLRGVARIRAEATQDLSRFDLDLRRGMHVRRLHVDGERADRSREGQELVITPRRAIDRGSDFAVRVRYSGEPRPVTDPDGSREGWLVTDDGAFVPNEPQGSPSWFPCSDHPTDKARYRFVVSVPHRLEAVANGRLVGNSENTGTSTYVWKASEPMATYLATVAIGNFRFRRSRIAGIPSLIAVDPRAAPRGFRAFARLEAMLRFMRGRFGPYPFETTGAIVDHNGPVPYALETQTRPLYPSPPSETLVAHELAHQWFGDAVTPARWRDIWLNEGFAQYAEWLWREHLGRQTAAQTFDRLYATPAADEGFWNPPPGRPGGPANLFVDPIYVRGGMTLQALRQEVGDEAFFRILRRWVADNLYGNATTRDFIALAEAESGLDLGPLFDAWLFRPGKPREW